MTSQPTEPNHIQQTLFAEDFPVKTSVQQVEAKVSRKLQGLVSGSNSSEPYAWYDQNTSSWKTCQRSLLTDWTSFSGTFTRQGYMNVNGAVFQVRLLELAIKEIDGGSSESLPTPTREAAHHRNNVPPSIGQTRGYDLTMKICEEQNKLLPTPLASDPDRKAQFKQGGTPLRAAIDREMLPTPTTMDHLGQRSPEALKKQMEGARKGRTSLSNLREAVNPKTVETFNNFLPTPRAAIGMGMKLSKGMANLEHKKYLETEIAAKVHTHGEVQNTDSTQTGENMYLNPQFVEEMMGYPLNWTLNKEFKDLKC